MKEQANEVRLPNIAGKTDNNTSQYFKNELLTNKIIETVEIPKS